MADALEALDQVDERLAALVTVATSGRSKRIPVAVVQPIARSLAKTYFGSVRQ